MRLERLCVPFVLLLVGAAVHAADDFKPGTLTPEEIEKGWILLFDGESLFGWKPVGESKWTIFEGMLYPQKGNTGTLVSTTAFADYELQVELQARPEPKGSGTGEPKTALRVGCDSDGNRVPGTRTIRARTYGSGWTTFDVRVKNGRVTSVNESSGGFKDSSREPEFSGEPPPARCGYIALSGEHLVIRSIKLRPENTKPLFNGKDLSGWKEIEGKKSKFSVNKDGFLEIKDGPGDIQTEGQWADFVLQLDCRCNGDNLNSGVFFRGLPGQFWQGYESQIFNKNDEAKPQEYTLEDFDPKTHELAGKRKEKYAAQDYGTGGIYNRQPARKQAAKDREWFGMTVVAQGRHMGVWVNGIMVTDWTDNRPVKDSARNGCRLEKGCISLQGHDPTTDLHFRNIRIAELPALAEK